MQLVISIDKDTYIRAKEQGIITDRTVVNAIANGTPLDKIRAEIEDLDDADYDYEGYYKAVTDAVKIIDKYRAESEDKE